MKGATIAEFNDDAILNIPAKCKIPGLVTSKGYVDG